MSDEPRRRGRDGTLESAFGRRRFIATGTAAGVALLAGCSSDDPSGEGSPTEDGDGSGGDEPASFRLLISDAPADIDDFDRLDVTFAEARVFEGGDDGEGTATETETDAETTETDAEGTATAGGEQNETVEEDQQQGTDAQGTQTDDGGETETPAGTETETENGTAEPTETGTESTDGTETESGTETEDGSGDDGDRGFYVLDLDSPTVDLTKVVGDKAQPIFDGELEAGSYQKLELHVESVEGVVDGSEVEVQVPSDKLQLTKPFEVRAGEELDFVFDINVVKRGNQDSYNLKPVISQSGVRGEDVEVEEVGEGGGSGGDAGGNESGGGNETDAGGNGGSAGGNESAGGAESTGGTETAGGNESTA